MIGINTEAFDIHLTCYQEEDACPYLCPVEAAFDFMGGKWKPLIIWHIGTKSRRYSDIKQAIPGISPHILSRQLKMLEKKGIIMRSQFESTPPRVEYCLTKAGLDLIPILDQACDWVIENFPECIPQGFIKNYPD